MHACSNADDSCSARRSSGSKKRSRGTAGHGTQSVWRPARTPSRLHSKPPGSAPETRWLLRRTRVSRRSSESSNPARSRFSQMWIRRRSRSIPQTSSASSPSEREQSFQCTCTASGGHAPARRPRDRARPRADRGLRPGSRRRVSRPSRRLARARGGVQLLPDEEPRCSRRRRGSRDERRRDRRPCQVLRNYGERDRFEHVLRGRNSRLDELQAAILVAKLPLLDEWNERRRAIASTYDAALAGTVARPPREAPGRRHVYHLYVVHVVDRSAFREVSWTNEVSAHRGPLPVADPPAAGVHPARQSGELSVVDAASATIVSLPLHADLTDAEVAYVADAVSDVLRPRRYPHSRARGRSARAGAAKGVPQAVFRAHVRQGGGRVGVVADQDDHVVAMCKRSLQLEAFVLIGVKAVVHKDADAPIGERGRQRSTSVSDVPFYA